MQITILFVAIASFMGPTIAQLGQFAQIHEALLRDSKVGLRVADL
jgi:hypothetical protein